MRETCGDEASFASRVFRDRALAAAGEASTRATYDVSSGVRRASGPIQVLLRRIDVFEIRRLLAKRRPPLDVTMLSEA